MYELKEIIKILKAVSDMNRCRIISALKERQDLCVCEIASIINISQPAISKHLKILENAGLIYSIKDGKCVNYRLNDNLEIKIKEILSNILSILKETDQIKSDKEKIKKVDRSKILNKS